MTAQNPPATAPQDRLGVGNIVSELRALRVASQRSRYGDGALPALPSRKEMITIVDGLVAALFPRHFGPPELTPNSVDGYLTFILEKTLRALEEQVSRELKLNSHGSGTTALNDAARAAEIAVAFAQSLPKVRALLDADIRAALEGDPAARSHDEIVFCYPGVAAVIRHRLAHQLYLLGAPMLARVIAEMAHSETGIDIHPGATIDESFFIDHGTGVVIGETARIGKHVRLYQAVTLGAKRFEVDEDGALVKGKDRHPILEDNVVVYAGATILGRITIGKGSSIGGNVWLTHSVPPGSNITQAKARSDSFDNGGGI
ncbi:serine O-acetyltransferase EpsC [Methylocystis sp. 9N]|uniref:serine O-acetyltransferase n=1 Tax=Methylocystis borbori TaxID=3118750 RepID=A0ABU7XCW4_9HYPH